MRKLNLRQLAWILRELRKGELSVYRIARLQRVSPRWVRNLRSRFEGVPACRARLDQPGRPRIPVKEQDVRTVLSMHSVTPMCAVKLEMQLGIDGNRIPHNRIHNILREAGKVNVMGRLIRRKSWVRYQRRHSNSLWHTDFCDIDGKHLIAYIDDASRFIVGFGFFSNATTENALTVLDSAIRSYGKPKQVMTDHGTQFCANEKKTYQFTESLKDRGVQHIMAKVKRPQSNGKIERWFGTFKRLYRQSGHDATKAVNTYNNMLHLSLDTTPAIAFKQKTRKS